MALLSIILPVVALALGWVSEMHQRHTLARRLDLLAAQQDTAALARSHAYADAHEAATRRYRLAVAAWVGTLPQASVARDVPERYEVAAAAQAIDRLESVRD